MVFKLTRPGLEPGITESKSVVLPITLSGCVSGILEMTEKGGNPISHSLSFWRDELRRYRSCDPPKRQKRLVVAKLHAHFTELQPNFVQRCHSEVATR